jgi:hypothetical protein
MAVLSPTASCHRLELALADAAWLDNWFGINTPGIEDLAWFSDPSGV